MGQEHQPQLLTMSFLVQAHKLKPPLADSHRLNTVLGEVGGATQQASGGFQGFNTNLGIMTGFIGTAAAGAFQFANCA